MSIILALITTALDKMDSEESDIALSELCAIGSLEVLEHAKLLGNSPISKERILATRILGQLENSKLESERFETLRKLLESETDPEVLACVAASFFFFCKKEILPQLRALLHHKDARVRSGAFQGLSVLTDDPEDYLCALRDEDPEVYVIAALKISQRPVFDSEEIRDELLDIAKEDTSCEEALLALAELGDLRTIPLIESKLEAEDMGLFAITAAARLGSKELLPGLLKFKAIRRQNIDILNLAIDCCR